MSDLLHCHGLRIQVLIGLNPFEREMTQSIEVDLTVETDFSHGPERDSQHGLVDYALLVRAVQAHVAGRQFDLIEGLCGDLAKRVLEINGVDAVRVKVTKRPKDLPALEAVSAECRRVRFG